MLTLRRLGASGKRPESRVVAIWVRSLPTTRFLSSVGCVSILGARLGAQNREFRPSGRSVSRPSREDSPARPTAAECGCAPGCGLHASLARTSRRHDDAWRHSPARRALLSRIQYGASACVAAPRRCATTESWNCRGLMPGSSVAPRIGRCHVWHIGLLLATIACCAAAGREPSYRLKSEEQFALLMVRGSTFAHQPAHTLKPS